MKESTLKTIVSILLLSAFATAGTFGADAKESFSTTNATLNGANATAKSVRNPEAGRQFSHGLKNVSGKSAKASVFVSLQNPDMDWWYKMPPYSEPFISEVRDVFYGQEFNIYGFVKSPSVKENKFSLSCSIVVESPDGKTSELLRDSKLEGFSKPDPDMIVACPDVIGGTMDSSFPEGRYAFVLTVRDENSGTVSVDRAYVNLKKWTPPNVFYGKRTVVEFMRNFFLQPTPENLYSILFSKDFSLEEKTAPNAINYTNVGFLRAAFLPNKFLIPILLADFKNRDRLDRSKIIFLFAILNENPVSDTLLNEREREYQKLLRESDIFASAKGKIDPIVGSTQIDMLWGEFFATGSFVPIAHILKFFEFKAEREFAEKCISEHKKPDNRKDWEKTALGILSKTAINMYADNIMEFEILYKYTQWAFLNKQLTPEAEALLTDICKKEGLKIGNTQKGEPDRKSAQ